MSLSKTEKRSKLTLAETLTPEQLALLARGRVDGWVTQNQVLAATPDVEDNVDNLDDLMTALEEAKIKVLESPPAESVRQSPPVEPLGPHLDEEALVIAAAVDDGVGV